ncbi:zinc finger transcription factor 1 [Purpureocillium lavendulum]|uniref:Zinc finger transcription factor 1 n=1 Tax=Purpureocillium lavendulum TaxID=1247861 RepID=A0AB34FKZ6_9HYPO|nr:zinc finger transcription factor 1 [Purpureocillium lavendulum]
MLCLSSRYLTAEETNEFFGLASGLDVCKTYTPLARALARASSDDPSVANIQGNLVLALSEFINNEGSSHWMYAGTAIRMAQIMRLNKEYHQSHTLKEQEIRRRTFWACLFMDKLLAFFLTKPPTLAAINIACALPGTDASLAYQEPTRGITVATLGSFAGFPSEIGILPYLIKTVCLYGDIVDMNVCNHRFVDKAQPTDPLSAFHRHHGAMKLWMDSLPPSLAWSEQNYANHAALGQGKPFVAIHFLTRSAFCVAHQAYLPQLDGSSILMNAVDAAGWSLLHREPDLISTCVNNALATASMASYLYGTSARARSDLQSVWVAASLFSVANTLLWLQYSNDPLYADAETIEKAEAFFNLVLDIMNLWGVHWRAARQWMHTFRAMRAMYRAAYLGEVDDTLLLGDALAGSSGSGAADEDSPSSGYRPRPGDGYISLNVVPSLYDSLRFLASDTSAEPKRLQSVWMQFASGWPIDFLNGMPPGDSAVDPESMASTVNGTSLPTAPAIGPKLPSPIHPDFLDRLDKDFIAYYNENIGVKPVTHNVTIEDIRTYPGRFASPWYKDFRFEPFVNDIKIKSDDGHEFAARVYTPDARTSPFGAGPYPVYINFHGGGYTFGSLQGDAELCMLIRDRVGIVVLDVDYRLCPENTFLKGHDDCWAAIRWVASHGQEINGRPDSISIGGISAGGHISAMAQQLARDENIDLKLAVLAVPATDSHLGLEKASDSPFPSFSENALAPCLNWARMKYFMNHCEPQTDAQRAELAARPVWHSSPIKGNLRGVCDTMVLTAECDPLRDEGEAYARKLTEAGVRVTVRRYTGVPHPFMHMLTINKAKMYINDVCAELRRVHGA